MGGVQRRVLAVHRVKGTQSVPWEPWGAQTAAFKGPLILNRTQLFNRAQFTQDTIRYLHEKDIGLLRKTDKLQKDTKCSLHKFCLDMDSDMVQTDTESQFDSYCERNTNT